MVPNRAFRLCLNPVVAPTRRFPRETLGEQAEHPVPLRTNKTLVRRRGEPLPNPF